MYNLFYYSSVAVQGCNRGEVIRFQKQGKEVRRILLNWLQPSPLFQNWPPFGDGPMRTFLGFGTNPISSKANQSKLTKQTVTNHTRNSDKCGCHLSENVDDWTWKIQNLFREKSSTPAPKHANVKDWVWQMQKGQTRKSRYRQGQIQSPVKQTNQNCVKVAAPSYVICCMLHAYIG